MSDPIAMVPHADDRKALEWRVPNAAVAPVNPYHTLYMRGSGLSEALMQEANEILMRSREMGNEAVAFGELAGAIAGINNEAAKVTRLLEEIRMYHPALYRIFQRAWGHDAP